MIEVIVRGSVDRAIREWKKKFDMAKTLRELRERNSYTKPSIKRRAQKLKAIYKEQYRNNSN